MRGTSSKTKTHRHRATDVPASTFYLVKLVEDDDYVALVITKWLRQDLGILSFLSKRTQRPPKIDGMTGTITSINF